MRWDSGETCEEANLMAVRQNRDAVRTVQAFRFRDCALVALATGRHAQNLRELREGIRYVKAGSIYYHFWGRFLRPTFDEPEYNNDFAGWVYHSLHDKTLAERLSVVNPARYTDLEELRQELLDIVETRLDESEVIAWTRADRPFHFIMAKTIVFDTGLEASSPEHLADLLPRVSSGTIFYHFIDARRRTPGHTDDFSLWLDSFGEEYRELSERLRGIDPYFGSLADLRREIIGVFQQLEGGPKGDGRHP
jgi:hypothetical protein